MHPEVIFSICCLQQVFFIIVNHKVSLERVTLALFYGSKVFRITGQAEDIGYAMCKTLTV